MSGMTAEIHYIRLDDEYAEDGCTMLTIQVREVGTHIPIGGFSQHCRREVAECVRDLALAAYADAARIARTADTIRGNATKTCEFIAAAIERRAEEIA